MENVFNVVSNMLSFIFDIRLFDVPLYLFYIGISCMIGYCISMFLIGFPCSIWEAITKKKVNEEGREKIVFILTVCLSIAFILRVLYEKTT